MHIALIVDEERLVHEQATLNRLAIGLIGEGAQVTRVVPETLESETIGEGERRIALATRVAAPMRVLPWMRRDRARRIAEAMERGLPDVLYALGDEAWSLAIDLGRMIERPVALDIWSAGQMRGLPRRRAATAVAGYIAPTRPIADALRERVDPGLVCHVPIGVSLPPKPRPILEDADRSIALAIIGGGRDVPSYRSLLSGLSRVVRQTPQVQVFLELSGPNEHEIWRLAKRLDLLENVSAITHASQHRALITHCDILLMPEHFGEVRSLLLEAMTFAIPIIASDDPFLDMLIDGMTACIVTPADAETWARQLRRLITEPDSARAIGLAGRERVASEHRSTSQVSRLMDAFQRIAHGDAIPFATHPD